MNFHHFLPLITKPTRFAPVSTSQPSLFQHIWIKSVQHQFKYNIEMHNVIDHLSAYLHLNINNLFLKNEEKNVNPSP